MPSLQENKAVVRRFFAALEDYCRGNETALDGIVAASFRDSVLGTQGIQASIGPMKELFTDLRCLLNDLLAEDERVIAHVSFEFTHTQPFMGMEPTHKRVQYVNVVALRIAQGQIVERMWNVANATHLLQQLSALSTDEG
jgi:predicted ester cyclase